MEDRLDGSSVDSGKLAQLGAGESANMIAGELAFAIAEAATVEEALRLALARMCEVAGACLGQAWTSSADGESLECTGGGYTSGDRASAFRRATESSRLSPGEGVTGRAWSTLRPTWADDVGADPHDPRAHSARSAGLGAGIAFPVITRDGFFGVLELLLDAPRASDQTLLDLGHGAATLVGSLIEHKRAEDELRESEARYRLLADNSTDVISVTDTSGLILYISPASRPLTGHEPHELIGRAGIELIHPEDRAMVSEAYRDLFEHAGAITSPPYRMLRKDGTIVWIESTVRAVRDPVTGEAIELQASARDISARMRADLALERTNAELERSNAELERFAYDASHDLGQPLRVIENLMKRLTEEQGQGLGPAGRRLVASALEGVGRMQTLIQDLLEYAKVSSEPLARNTVDCSEIVDQILEVFAEAIAEKNGLISAGRLPSVTAHQAQIRQLFQNLLSNAIKFTRDAEPPRVAIDAERQDGEWKFSVVDNGIGIEERDAERIFEMFRRLHAPDAYAGNGMGLSICKRIVERHGGRIWAGPAGGGGSALFFTLPDVKV